MLLTIRRHKIFAKTASCGNLETTKIHPLVKNVDRKYELEYAIRAFYREYIPICSDSK